MSLGHGKLDGLNAVSNSAQQVTIQGTGLQSLGQGEEFLASLESIKFSSTPESTNTWWLWVRSGVASWAGVSGREGESEEVVQLTSTLLFYPARRHEVAVLGAVDAFALPLVALLLFQSESSSAHLHGFFQTRRGRGRVCHGKEMWWRAP